MHRKGIACLAGLAGLYAFFIAAGSLSQTARPGEDSYHRGRVLANQYDCAGAIKEFDRAVNANPNDPRYYVGRANCRMHQLANTNPYGEDAEAASVVTAIIDGDLSAAIKADSKYALAYFERAKARQRLMFQAKNSNPASALSDFDKALELEPENLVFLLGRAHFLLIDVKNEKRGLEDMALLIKREPKQSGHLYVRGRYFIEAGRFPEAIRDLSMALKLEPRDTFVRVLHARAYFGSNNYAAALAV